MAQKKTDLEKEIEAVCKKLGIPLLEKYETTPGIGNCWYEAISSLMRLYNMKKISAKQLRKEIIDNMENCKNFEVVNELLKFDGRTIEEFKEEHRQEGTFTDENGIMAITTAMYLGITLRIVTKTNTEERPYTEYNEGKPHTFYIFHDTRGPGHFQSLKPPKIKKSPANRYSLEESSDSEIDMDEVINDKNISLENGHAIDNKNEDIKEIRESFPCNRCNKSFQNIKHLAMHHVQFNKAQCVLCHKEISNHNDLEKHEIKHKDTEGYYNCNLCEEKYKSEPTARLHAVCHNPYEILKQIKKIQINLFNQMYDVSPEIINKAKNEFIWKQTHDREIRTKHEDSLKKAAKEATNKRNEKANIEINLAMEVSLREAKEKEMKEKLESKKAVDESLNIDKEDPELKKAMEESKIEAEKKKIESLKEELDVERAKKASLNTDKEDPEFKKAMEESKIEAKKEKIESLKEELDVEIAKKESLKSLNTDKEDPEFEKAMEESKIEAEKIKLEHVDKIKEYNYKKFEENLGQPFSKDVKKNLEFQKILEETIKQKSAKEMNKVLEASLREYKEKATKEREQLDKDKLKAQEEAQARKKELNDSVKKATLEINKRLEEAINKNIQEQNELKEKQVLQTEEEIKKKIEESKRKAQEVALTIDNELKETIKKAKKETIELKRKMEEEKNLEEKTNRLKQEEILKTATNEAIKIEKQLKESNRKAKEEALKIEKKLEISKRKAEEEAMEMEQKMKDEKEVIEMERKNKAKEESLKKIIEEELNKTNSEQCITIKDLQTKSKVCLNCFDDKCQSKHKNNKSKSKNLKNESFIEEAITNKVNLTTTEKDLLLESMSKYNENIKNTSKKTPQQSMSRKSELDISLAKNEISELIGNKSEIGEIKAIEILELMQNCQEDCITPDNEGTDFTQPDKKETEKNTIECTAACNTRLTKYNYIDHILECEIKIEECWRCGEEFKNNDVHRSLEKHSTPEQRFACMTCMHAHASRLRIADNHRYICMGSGTKKILVNDRTPETTGEDMQQAYDENPLIKKILKEDFRKRNRKYRKKKKGTNPIKTIVTVLSAVSLIYMIIFLMMKYTEKAEMEKILNESRIKNSNKIYNSAKPNQRKNSKTLIEDTIKKKDIESTIEESIAILRDKHSNHLTQQAIDKFLQHQEEKMKKLILGKIKNLELLQNNENIKEKHSENDYEPNNKENEVSFNLKNILNKILDLQITREVNKATVKNSPNDVKIAETNMHDYGQSNLNTEPNSENIEETNAHDYGRNNLNTESKREDIEESNTHDYVWNKLNTQSDKRKNSDFNQNCRQNSKQGYQTNVDLEHVLSKTIESLNGPKITTNKYSQREINIEPNSEYIEATNAHDYDLINLNKEPNSEYNEATNANDYGQIHLSTEPNSEYIEETNTQDYDQSNLNTEQNSEYIEETNAHDYSQREKNINSNKIQEDIQLERSTHVVNLLTEIQSDLVKLNYIKNYKNQKHSLTQESINSTQARSTQSTYFIVQSDLNRMLISEENLESSNIFKNIGLQLIQANTFN